MRAGSRLWVCLILLTGGGLCPTPLAIAAPDPDAETLASAEASIRAGAARRIGEIGRCSDTQMQTLITLLSDSTRLTSATTAPAAGLEASTVSDVAADALGRLGAPAAKALIAAMDRPARRDAHGRIAMVLGALAPKQAAPAVLRYVKRHVNSRQPWDVSLSVAWLGRDVVPVLIGAMETGVLELQVVAAKDLGDIGDRRGLVPVLAAARRLAPVAASMPTHYSKRREIVLFRAAAPSVAKLGGAASFEQIRRWQSSLAACWDVATQRALILSLAHTHDERAIPILAALLADGAPQDRRSAADALGLGTHPEAATHLIAAIGDDDAGVRASVAAALGSIDDPASAQALIALLTDPSLDVRARAAASLSQLAGVDLGATPEPWRQWLTEWVRLRAERADAPPSDTDGLD